MCVNTRFTPRRPESVAVTVAPGRDVSDTRGTMGAMGEFGGEFAEVPTAVLAGAAATLADEPETDQVLVTDRIRRHWPDLLRGLELAYGDRAPQVAADAVATAVARFAERSPELRLLDLRRLAAPDWFQHPRMLGYACYTERFGGDLAGVAAHVDYLAELGVTYLHLMPLLDPRPAPNDGGYAVRDYRTVRPDLGTMDDLAELARVLREHDISLTLDLVLNHVAREHDWARAGAGGGAALPRLLPRLRRPRAAGRLRREPARRVPRPRARQLHLGRRPRRLGVDDVQLLAVGPELAQPRRVRRVRGPHPRTSPTRAWSACGWTRSRSSGSGSAPPARTSRRCTR